MVTQSAGAKGARGAKCRSKRDPGRNMQGLVGVSRGGMQCGANRCKTRSAPFRTPGAKYMRKRDPGRKIQEWQISPGAQHAEPGAQH